jgi:NTP pyrophosphatase (non-canonical NTP hydrolase)
MQITKKHLAFLEEAKEAFENDIKLHTYRNEEETFIALRRGMDRDCIDVYELGENVAFFAQQLNPIPSPREELHWFIQEMEKKLEANDHKGGWENCTNGYLCNRLKEECVELFKEISYQGPNIVNEAADVANIAMMIADIARKKI